MMKNILLITFFTIMFCQDIISQKDFNFSVRVSMIGLQKNPWKDVDGLPDFHINIGSGLFVEKHTNNFTLRFSILRFRYKYSKITPNSSVSRIYRTFYLPIGIAYKFMSKKPFTPYLGFDTGLYATLVEGTSKNSVITKSKKSDPYWKASLFAGLDYKLNDRFSLSVETSLYLKSGRQEAKDPNTTIWNPLSRFSINYYFPALRPKFSKNKKVKNAQQYFQIN